MSMRPPAGQSQQPQKLKTGLMATLAILTMLAAGCGSDTDTATPAETAEETSTAAPAPTPEDPEPEAEPEPEYEYEYEYGDGSMATRPLEPGSYVWLTEGDAPAWELQVFDVDWDYTQDDFPESPLGAYAALYVEVTNMAEYAQDPYVSLSWQLFDPWYTEFYNECLQPAYEDLWNVGELEPGETATGVIVFEVYPSVSEAVIGFSTFDSEGTWLAVN
jgi:hypothetical protein